MLDIIIITIGKVKDKNYQGSILEFLKRIKPYAKIKIEELSTGKLVNNDFLKVKNFEQEKIIQALKKYQSNNIFILTEKGNLFDSFSLAKKLENISGKIIFVIGGTFGFTPDFLENIKAQKISLSPLTFPHELARVILLEQIYRAATIIAEKEYHY